MVTQTLLLIMVGAAVRSSDVVKAGGKKTLAMDAQHKLCMPPLQAKQFWPASNHFLLQSLVFGQRVVL